MKYIKLKRGYDIMKKKYIAPESKLIAINLKESIAVSGGIDAVEGSASISFTSQRDGCRDLYTGVVKQEANGTTFMDYYTDFRDKVQSNFTNMDYLGAWFKCYNQGF